MVSIKVEPISDAVGAKITNIDVGKEMTPDVLREVHQAWLDYQVLVFPEQQLDEEDQIRFTANFGEVGGRNRKVPTAEGNSVSHPGIMLISNIRKDGKPIGSLPDGEMMFHSDGAYAKRPFRYTLLYAIEVPSFGGNTKFSNMYKAYDALPEDFKIISDKTASLFSSCCKMGAISTNSKAKNIDLMSEFGLLVGKAFQIRDDLFGYLSYDTGKPSLNDFKQAKITLPLIHSLSKVNSIKQKEIISNLKKFKSIDKVISFVKENGGIDYSEKIMCNLINSSYDILNQFPESKYKNSLQNLLEYTIRREL